MKLLMRVLWVLIGAAVISILNAYSIASGIGRSQLVSFLIIAVLVVAGHIIEWSVEYLVLRRNMKQLVEEDNVLWITRADAIVYGEIHDIDAEPSADHIVLLVKERD